ncbi:MAG: type II secretion system F family protein [Pseudohongiella sp.]|nr:type II secretion system F family protein [Pseudohongiella sp.]
MPLYKYKAMNQLGKMRTGNLDAANEVDLEQRLSRMKLDLVTYSETVESSSGLGQKKITKPDLINFCFNMEQLTRAGVPLLEGLSDLRDSMEHPRFREVISNLVDEIQAGKSLSDALAEHPKIFDVLFVNLIRAGEASGELAKVFDSLMRTIKWQDELQTSTKKLLTTPMIVGGVVLAVTGFLMVYLVPQLVSFILSMGEELPIHTRALIATSNFLVNYWYVVISVPIATYYSLKTLIQKNEQARFYADKFKLKSWKIGPVLQKIILSRFANFFAMMYSAGIPVLRCLEIAEGVVDNTVVRQAMADARQDIQEGDPIARSFENTGLFPPLVIRMLKIGETTGELDKALLNISYFYDRDIKESIDQVQSLIQPIMTAVLGTLLGWVMLSVLGPIYNTIASVQF